MTVRLCVTVLCVKLDTFQLKSPENMTRMIDLPRTIIYYFIHI